MSIQTCPTAKETRLKSKIARKVTVDWKALLAMATRPDCQKS